MRKQMTDFKLWLLELFNCVKKTSGSNKDFIYKMYLQIIYIYIIYLYKEDLALNKWRMLIYHKTKSDKIIYI